MPTARSYGRRRRAGPADVAIKPRPTSDDAKPYVRSYVFMRLCVAALGIAVPLVLVLGEPLVFDGQPFVRGSLSAYYYSGAASSSSG